MKPSSHVLITGASGGIGQALALEYAAAGLRLTLCGRDAGRLDALAAWCRERGAVVAVVQIDLRQGEAVRACLQAIDDADPVDTVIANAGVNSSLGPGGEAEAIEDVRRCFAVNALGAVETLSAFAERMRRREEGRLAVVASLGGWCGMPSAPSYGASKAAAMVYGEGLRSWLAPHGVTVTVISPGFVDSPMSRRYLGDKSLIWSAPRAARYMRRGIDRGRREVAFPLSMAVGLRLLMLLPAGLRDAIIRHQCAFTVIPDAESPRSKAP